MSRPVLFQLLVPVWLVILPGCSAGPMGGDAVGPSGPAGRADLATQHACRARVNEMYETRNRADIYAPNSMANSPYSANSQVGVPSTGLSSRFAYEQSVAECERNAVSDAGDAAVPPASPPPAGAKGR
jgi:hypothetical protein